MPAACRARHAPGRLRALRRQARPPRARAGRDDRRAGIRRGLRLGRPDRPGAQAGRAGGDDHGNP
ncbi:MAG: hypothetical protein AMJ63_00660 [Myxococcales bacterium SG8_38_1]|nr:MAG: hypothetical protein AMJ63_00660 [Myxococcales bacterium SG8_38_1]